MCLEGHCDHHSFARDSDGLGEDAVPERVLDVLEQVQGSDCVGVPVGNRYTGGIGRQAGRAQRGRYGLAA